MVTENFTEIPHRPFRPTFCFIDCLDATFLILQLLSEEWLNASYKWNDSLLLKRKKWYGALMQKPVRTLREAKVYFSPLLFSSFYNKLASLPTSEALCRH